MKNNWIKVSEEMPKELIGVALLYDVDGVETNWDKGYLYNGQFYVAGNKPFKYEVLAWFRPELPEPNTL